jgi:pimeloyl-ACP methyl ester carboxylesterase
MDDWPSDVAELVEHLAIGRFAAIGYSGGGPDAAVCAAELADRSTGAAAVAGVTDSRWREAWDGTAGVDVTPTRLRDETAATAWPAAH